MHVCKFIALCGPRFYDPEGSSMRGGGVALKYAITKFCPTLRAGRLEDRRLASMAETRLMSFQHLLCSRQSRLDVSQSSHVGGEFRGRHSTGTYQSVQFRRSRCLKVHDQFAKLRVHWTLLSKLACFNGSKNQQPEHVSSAAAGKCTPSRASRAVSESRRLHPSDHIHLGGC
jgi:hypothetical protein